MDGTVTDSRSLADRAVERERLRKPFREASAAADLLHDVLRESVVRGYPGSLSFRFETTSWKSPLLFVAATTAPLTFVQLLFYGGPIPLAEFVYTAVMSSLPPIAGWMLIAPMCGGPEPAKQFAVAKQALVASAARLPDGADKDLVSEFVRAAQQTFVLAEIATIEKWIANGQDSPRRLRKAEEEGLALIGKAAKVCGWDEKETEQQKTMFRQGEGPSPVELMNAATRGYTDVQSVLKARAGITPSSP